MPSEITKEMKCVVTFLLILCSLVLGSYIIDRDIKDILYVSFIMMYLLKYILICRK